MSARIRSPKELLLLFVMPWSLFASFCYCHSTEGGLEDRETGARNVENDTPKALTPSASEIAKFCLCSHADGTYARAPVLLEGIRPNVFLRKTWQALTFAQRRNGLVCLHILGIIRRNDNACSCLEMRAALSCSCEAKWSRH